jgi:hypothetical protein
MTILVNGTYISDLTTKFPGSAGSYTFDFDSNTKGGEHRFEITCDDGWNDPVTSAFTLNAMIDLPPQVIKQIEPLRLSSNPTVWTITLPYKLSKYFSDEDLTTVKYGLAGPDGVIVDLEAGITLDVDSYTFTFDDDTFDYDTVGAHYASIYAYDQYDQYNYLNFEIDVYDCFSGCLTCTDDYYNTCTSCSSGFYLT